MFGPDLLLTAVLLTTLPGASTPGAQETPREDTIPTSSGDLTITFLGHATLMFRYGGKVIHIDPVRAEADYATLPKADLILVTHEHGDHLDPVAIDQIRKPDTRIVVSRSCTGRVPGAEVMTNGERRDEVGLHVQAVPAYNLVHMRSPGVPYHAKGDGNGYILTFGDVRVYVAGDTENTPEMKALDDIDVAFLPMNLPYTMTPEMVADAARAFRPHVLYPYHYGATDPRQLVRLLADEPGIEVRVRDLQ